MNNEGNFPNKPSSSGEEPFYSGKLKLQPFYRRHGWMISTWVLAGLVIILIVLLVFNIFAPKQQIQPIAQVPPAGTISQSQVPTPEPTPTPTPTVVPKTVGTVLCQSDWSSGINGWIGTQDWKALNGMLINDGTNIEQDKPTLLAPCDLNDVPNYRVEAKIQVQRQSASFYDGNAGFGFYVRYISNNKRGYTIRDIGSPLNTLIVTSASRVFSYTYLYSINFVPGTEMHTYMIEVKDNHIKVFIDEGFVADVIDNESLAGGSVGLWDKQEQIAVSSFKVTLV